MAAPVTMAMRQHSHCPSFPAEQRPAGAQSSWNCGLSSSPEALPSRVGYSRGCSARILLRGQGWSVGSCDIPSRLSSQPDPSHGAAPWGNCGCAGARSTIPTPGIPHQIPANTTSAACPVHSQLSRGSRWEQLLSHGDDSHWNSPARGTAAAGWAVRDAGVEFQEDGAGLGAFPRSSHVLRPH